MLTNQRLEFARRVLNKEQFDKRGTQFRGTRRRPMNNQELCCCSAMCAMTAASTLRGGGLPCMFFPFFC